MYPFVLAGQGLIPERHFRNLAFPRGTGGLWVVLVAIARDFIGIIRWNRCNNQWGEHRNQGKYEHKSKTDPGGRGLN